MSNKKVVTEKKWIRLKSKLNNDGVADIYNTCTAHTILHTSFLENNNILLLILLIIPNKKRQIDFKVDKMPILLSKAFYRNRICESVTVSCIVYLLFQNCILFLLFISFYRKYVIWHKCFDFRLMLLCVCEYIKHVVFSIPNNKE